MAGEGSGTRHAIGDDSCCSSIYIWYTRLSSPQGSSTACAPAGRRVRRVRSHPSPQHGPQTCRPGRLFAPRNAGTPSSAGAARRSRTEKVAEFGPAVLRPSGNRGARAIVPHVIGPEAGAGPQPGHDDRVRRTRTPPRNGGVSGLWRSGIGTRARSRHVAWRRRRCRAEKRAGRRCGVDVSPARPGAGVGRQGT